MFSNIFAKKVKPSLVPPPHKIQSKNLDRVVHETYT